ncbi:MAG: 3-phosphoserine/phosphohydroxythreonine transaminase [Schleiferiaceae bacterium]|jgi:phosphoserine aminotransferase|nr:MAG: 3-phosphoserine/phosphohydroxythreonine aminotransferase [Cryomorphaceae bacterium BACL23 MAG-120924-bin60]MBL6627080.1 3-phosphoserine/phosphohydroxythreonine transaminase [Cryomorphaceae bacterium]MDP5067601.1 3-phosphoserine/phosphohydroxythreonine transaminase [Schleiferiaceae bacterium]NDD18994.1 3-phosphoserine/phosphohydroxythreonine transaminase [Flavobacteriia bacterium]
MKKHNFSAGPCILAPEVLQGAANAVENFAGMDLSLIEISHRDKKFVAVMDEAIALSKELMGLGADYEVLFLQGGASMQFCMVPYNLLKVGGKAGYTVTGTWAKKAAEEAKLFGDVAILGSSADKNFSYIPKGYTVGEELDYFHCTSNNTIFGTQMKDFPTTGTRLVCDMSSDIFSRQLDFTQFDLIYAGAQKNLGPAGATLVAVKKDILGQSGRPIPSMLDYQTHIDGESMFNTPPVFSVYTSLLTLRWMKDQGGLAAMERHNAEKAALLYAEIDRNSLFYGTAAKEDRSDMNACFLLHDEAHSEQFNTLWKEAGIVGIAGHRSVGGYRASMYNALPLESVQVLVDVMQHLEKTI